MQKSFIFTLSSYIIIVEESIRGENMRKMLLIVNPAAGKKTAAANLLEAVQIFSRGGYEVTVKPTTAVGDARLFAKEGSGRYDLIACWGGDGTMNEALSGVMESETRPPLGFIPAGTTNDFAKSLGIPSDFRQAAKNIVLGERYPCDVGDFNGRSFTYVAAFGAFTKVSYSTDQQFKNVLGRLAYIIEGIAELPNIQGQEMTVSCDGKVYRGNYIFGAVTNSVSVGGFQSPNAKNISLNDGFFEVVLIRMPENIQQLASFLEELTKLQKFPSDDQALIQYFCAKEATFVSKKEIPWTLDGENGGKWTQAVVKNIHNGAEFLVKKPI